MALRFTRRLATTGLILAVLAGGAGSAASAQAQDFFFTYQKQPHALLLDTTRIAIFRDRDAQIDRGQVAQPVDVNARAAHPDARPMRRDELAQKLAPVGVDADQLKPADLPGWSILSLDPGARDQRGVLDLIAQLAQDEDIQFVSPVFVDEHGDRIIKRDIIVGFEPDISPKDAQAAILDMNLGEILDRDYLNMPGVYRVRAESRNALDVLSAANLMAQRPEVAFAEPDMLQSVRVDLIPNDAFFSSLWGIRQNSDVDMDGDEAWDITTGAASVITAVLDTGGQSAHPDLNTVPGYDATGQFSSGEPVTTCDNHGTAVAGTIAARINNSIGVVGIAPNTRVANVKVLTIPSAAPCGNSGTGGSAIFADALNWARTNGARVTNASLGFGPSGTVDSAYLTARNAGLINFAATGNDGTGTIGYPSSNPNVNAVGAISQSGARAGFSQFGTGIDFMAPGNGIVTTDRTGAAGDSGTDYQTTSGTSFASPYAAGVAALILSFNNTLSPANIESTMQTSATDLGVPGYDTTHGFGLVNARAALNITPPPGPPGAFSLQTPSNGQTQVLRLPTLSWDSSVGAANFNVLVDNNADFSSPEINANTTLTSYTHTGTPLVAATTYFWRVTASNGLGSTVSTPASRSFQTISSPPGSFNLTSPANGQTNEALTPVFSWAASSLAEDYTIVVDDNADFSSPVTNATVAALIYVQTTPLLGSTTYFWRVTANNPLGNTVSSPSSRSFTTIGAAPGPFNLSLPADGVTITTTTPTLSWTASTGATNYTVLVDDTFNFSSPEVNIPAHVGTSYLVTPGVLLNGNFYFWRIVANNGTGSTSSTPTTRSFSITAPAQCQGDANGDGFRNFADISAVLTSWGTSGPQGDANHDGSVNFADISAVLTSFNINCP